MDLFDSFPMGLFKRKGISRNQDEHKDNYAARTKEIEYKPELNKFKERIIELMHYFMDSYSIDPFASKRYIYSSIFILGCIRKIDSPYITIILDYVFGCRFRSWQDYPMVIESNVNSFRDLRNKMYADNGLATALRFSTAAIETDEPQLVHSFYAWIIGWYTVFWHLFMAAIDEDIYENHLSDIIDMATILGLDADDIRDMCTAVNLILDGKNPDVGDYVTAKGKEFFGHE